MSRENKKKDKFAFSYSSLVIQMSHSMFLVNDFPILNIKVSLVLSKEFRIVSQMNGCLHVSKFSSADIPGIISRVWRQ